MLGLSSILPINMMECSFFISSCVCVFFFFDITLKSIKIKIVKLCNDDRSINEVDYEKKRILYKFIEFLMIMMMMIVIVTCNLDTPKYL